MSRYYEMQLYILEKKYDRTKTHEMLFTMADGIEKILENIKDLLSADNIDIVEVAELGQELDDSIGLAFVLIQSSITYTASMVQRIYEHALSSDKVRLDQRFKDRKNIIRIDSELVADEAFSNIEKINAVANMFKHQDEWKNWNDTMENSSKSQSARTMSIVSSLGCKEGGSFNYQKVFLEITGRKDYANLFLILDIIYKWRLDIMNQLSFELISKKLVK